MSISPLEIEIVTKLVLAILLGGLVGLEREIRHRPAGLRTNMLICLGATMFTVISLTAFNAANDAVSRVIGYIVVGVGFIGSGAVAKEEHAIHGLTTAALVWIVAAIGIAIGFGMYFLAVSAEVIVLVVLFVVRYFERSVEARLETDKEITIARE